MIPRPNRITLALLLLIAGTANAAPQSQSCVVIMRDGTTLATDLYLPDSTPNRQFPVILARTPYNKTASTNTGWAGTQHGYAVVIQDTRGRFQSKGENLPFHLDGPDGLDTVRWILKQPWCDGRIGTLGGSAGAITQFQLLASEAPAILAQHLVVGSPNIHDVVYLGGVFRKSLVEDWTRAAAFQPDAVNRWTTHPSLDAYWLERDASRHYPASHAAAVHIGGYWDIFAQSTLDGFNGYQLHGGKGAKARQKLLFGPWTHGVLQEKAGDLKFPGANKPPGKLQDTWFWFDRIFKPNNPSIDQLPAVTYYVIGDVSDPTAPGNYWRTANQWPPVPAHITPWFLHPEHQLTKNPPTRTHSLSYRYDPHNPTPTIGGIQLTIPAGPIDQRPIESRPDVLLFSSEPLSQPIEVTGRVRARLWITSDAPDTDFFVRLCDVYPDGRSFNLCEGALRTRFRSGPTREQPLTPGQPTPIEIDCWSTSTIFNRGHRIRIQVTSSSSPGYDPNPNTGHPLRADTQTRVALNTILLDPNHPSQVLLPVVPPPQP